MVARHFGGHYRRMLKQGGAPSGPTAHPQTTSV
jgi:hypothetical protein